MRFGDRRAGRSARFWLMVAAACAILAGPVAANPPCPAAGEQTLRLPATKLAVSQGQPVTIVAFGSSSTEGAGASAPSHAYPAALEQRLRAAWPGSAVTVLNRGRGGEIPPEMMARLDADVLAAKPTLVIWQSGGNAALRGLDPETFARLTAEGIGIMNGRGIDVILMDNQRAPRIVAKPGHAIYGEILARAATGPATSLFSRWSVMGDWAAHDPHGPAMIGPDGLHHTDRGYACLADALARAITGAVASPSVTASAAPAAKQP